jgi:hypothetical protein
MPGILPDTESAGGVVYRDLAGNPTNPPDVQNAYSPAPAFVANCELTALPADCDARIEPRQLNAIVSELLALAECFDPDGPWDCNSVNNLCAAWTVRAYLLSRIGIKTSDEPPVDPFDGQLWWETDTGLLYVRYNDGNSSQWVVAFPQPSTDQFVLKSGDAMTGPLSVPTPTSALHAVNKAYADAALRIDGVQSLTPAQKAQARSNISAAPFDAMAHSGLQLNGSFEIDQVNSGAIYSIAAGAQDVRIVDGWSTKKVGTNAYSVKQDVGTAPGFPSMLRLTVTTAQSPMNTDYISIAAAIEGRRTARLQWGTANAQAVTVGFWVRTTVAGPVLLRIYNSDYSAVTANVTVTVTHPNVWQYVTATFPGMATGVWGVSSGVGLRLVVYPAHASGINIAIAATNTFDMTGVILLPGTEAPPAERSAFVMRPYEQEMLTCKRYYEYGTSQWVGYTGAAAAQFGGHINYVEKRAIPVLTKGTFTAGTNCTTDLLDTPSIRSARHTCKATGIGGFSGAEIWYADARL